jgi:hypothetical protein
MKLRKLDLYVPSETSTLLGPLERANLDHSFSNVS